MILFGVKVWSPGWIFAALAVTLMSCNDDVKTQKKGKQADDASASEYGAVGEGGEDSEDSEDGSKVKAKSGVKAQGTDDDALRDDVDLSKAKVPSEQEAHEAIAQDGKGSEKNIVYVDIRHLAKSEQGTSDLDVVRFGLAKALNSVSLNTKIVRLNHIEESRTVFRVNLDDYTLTSSWPIVTGSKYAKDNITTVSGATVVKGDWLVWALSRPEVYDLIMRIPQAVPLFEAALKFNRNEAIYLNVPKSGVTFTGRVLERIPIDLGGKPGGYYWRSYDFGLEASRIAGFANPATLQASSAAVLPLVAGEYIFSLPNGMQAYMLSGFALQTRIDAQLFVATDPRRPQDALDHCVEGSKCGFVINGESCMSCHKSGMKHPENIEGVKPAGNETKIKELMKADQQRFVTALKEMGYDINGAEPIWETSKLFRTRAQISDKRAQGGEFEGTLRATAGPMFER